MKDTKKCPRCQKKMKVIKRNIATHAKLWKCKCGVEGWDNQIKDLEKEDSDAER